MNLYTLIRTIKPGDRIRACGGKNIYVYCGYWKGYGEFRSLFREEGQDELCVLSPRIEWEKVE